MQDSQTSTSGQRPAISRPSRPRRPSRFRLRPAQSGFTLTELLIVIAIIAVLAGLIAAAAINALRKGRQTGVLLEIKNLSTAVENFKNETGVYPPNGMNPDPGNTATGKLLQSDFQRMFAKAFAGSAEPQVLALALCGQNTAGGANQNIQNGMTAAEGVYFWLGGFSSDKKFPISGPGGPSFPVDGPQPGEVLENRIGGYEFDRGRLGPRTDEGVFDEGDGRYLLYSVDLNQNGTIDNNAGENRRINLWRFNPKGSDQPLVYIDTSRHKPYQYDAPASQTAAIFALKKLREGITSASSMQDIAFIDQKFQILHCGLDDDWGNFGTSASVSGANASNMLLYPDGPFIGPVADTLTNFADGELASESE